MSLMEGAGPGLIAVLVLELNYVGCTVLVRGSSCAIGVGASQYCLFMHGRLFIHFKK